MFTITRYTVYIRAESGRVNAEREKPGFLEGVLGGGLNLT